MRRMIDVSATHNKKRNVGLLYEFLLRTASRGTVDDDRKLTNDALQILYKRFKVGTELYKEFRLFNALVRTTVSSDAIAGSILREARNAALTNDVAALEREKTTLIHEINRKLNGDGMFFEQPIDDYKIYATVQTLINDWRAVNGDIARRAMYEDKLVEWLRSDKERRLVEMQDSERYGVERLAYRIMMKKFNEKFGVLSPTQKSLIREHVFTSNGGSRMLVERLEMLRGEILDHIDRSLAEDDLKEVSHKLEEVRANVVGENLDVIDDDKLVRFLMYTKLCDELASKDGE